MGPKSRRPQHHTTPQHDLGDNAQTAEVAKTLFVRITVGPRAQILDPSNMVASRKTLRRNGRLWTVSKIRVEEAEPEDLRFWYDDLTPEQRVDAVYDALEMCLKVKGVDGVPRLRRVHRLIKRTQR